VRRGAPGRLTRWRVVVQIDPGSARQRSGPSEAIIDAVREYDASVVVRSNYERHDLADWLRGAIVDEVTRKMHIPVPIVDRPYASCEPVRAGAMMDWSGQ
jgi:hypothetical protein